MKKVNQDFDTSILRILVSPKTHTKLTFDNTKLALISKAAGLAYPIKSGIPILLESAARKLNDDL